ncbi:ABC transporter permease subunit [Hoeflea sp. WL0058]|uniref:ABC transporter permease subunit n=1 Tax=Flavimaribacter sediminis TaxID=2865987 RepID=A0AAE2ZM13_9HYPH|nr:ABC transporter permease subunit [Flavimaribacter sediminis]MBW8638459.1 ABC transporter permease subunit [Flavimaribacter sediminis]
MSGFVKWLAIALIVYFLVFPLLMLGLAALTGSPYTASGPYLLDGFGKVLSDRAFYNAFLTSLVLSSLTALGSLALGSYFAVIATRMDVPLRGWITPSMVIITATPGLFYAMSWSMLANANAGVLAKILTSIGLGSVGQVLNAVSWPGLVVVSIFKVTGFAYLFLIGPISASDRSQEDAAVVFGSSRFVAFMTVTLPSLAPAYLAVGILMLVFGMQTFDIPAVLGVPVGIQPLSLLVNDYLIINVRPDWAAASSTAVLMTLFVAVLVCLQIFMLHGKDFASLGGRAQNGPTRPPRSLGWLVSASIGLYCLLAIAAPIVQFVIGAFQPFFGLYGAWTLGNFVTVLTDRVGVTALRTTLLIVFIAAPVTVISGFLMAYAMSRYQRTLVSSVARLGSWVPATTPGIVLSVALLATFIQTPGIRKLFGSPVLMALALVVGGIPIAVRAAESMVAQVSPDLESAARVSGAGAFSATFGIVARLCAPALLGAWLLISLWMAGTLDVPMLLQSSRSQTIATYSYSLFANGQTSEAAAIFVLFIGSFALCILLLTALAGLAARLRNRVAGA